MHVDRKMVQISSFAIYWILCMLFPTQSIFAQASPEIELKVQEKGVDVWISGVHVTSYIYPEEIRKSSLYPIKTLQGTSLTRGWPLEPRPRERVDHRHHVGLWFNHGDVNGLDFWNSSPDRKAEQVHHYGLIKHKRVKELLSSDELGRLVVELTWEDYQGKVLLYEEKVLEFRKWGDNWVLDHHSQLTAADSTVVFGDTKEGMFAIRLARQLELVEDKPTLLTDANGKPMTEKVVDLTGVSGSYHTSRGHEGKAAWGTRNEWIRLSGNIEDEQISVVIFDHPGNMQFPAYWHARGYGLFAINNLGRKSYDKKQEELSFSLPAGKSISFQHRVLIHSGKVPSDADLNKLALRKF